MSYSEINWPLCTLEVLPLFDPSSRNPLYRHQSQAFDVFAPSSANIVTKMKITYLHFSYYMLQNE